MGCAFRRSLLDYFFQQHVCRPRWRSSTTGQALLAACLLAQARATQMQKSILRRPSQVCTRLAVWYQRKQEPMLRLDHMTFAFPIARGQLLCCLFVYCEEREIYPGPHAHTGSAPLRRSVARGVKSPTAWWINGVLVNTVISQLAS